MFLIRMFNFVFLLILLLASSAISQDDLNIQTIQIGKETLTIEVLDNNYNIEYKSEKRNFGEINFENISKISNFKKEDYITILDKLIPTIKENQIKGTAPFVIYYSKNSDIGYRIKFKEDEYSIVPVVTKELLLSLSNDLIQQEKIKQILDRIKFYHVESKKLADFNSFDVQFLSQAPKLETVRERYFISRYLTNYAFLDYVNEPTENGKGEVGRCALKFQISLKYPLLSWKYYNTGVYFAMTYKALFDLFEDKNSRPVLYKNYQPELFLKYDIEQMFKMVGQRNLNANRPKASSIQLGGYHLSNGGSETTHAYLTSRSLQIVFYGQYNCSYLPIGDYKDQQSVYSSEYQLNLHFKLTRYIDKWIEDNPDIYDYIALKNTWALDVFGSFEQATKKTNFLGIIRVDAELSPTKKYLNHGLALSITPRWDLVKASKIRLPFTFYIKYFQGYFEYLELYGEKRQVFGFGMKLRP